MRRTAPTVFSMNANFPRMDTPSTDYAERRHRGRDGLTLYARDYAGASGPARCPVVCLHGLTRNSGDFEDLAPRIAALGRRVLAFDVRGRGESDCDPDIKRYQPLVYALDTLEFMDALGIGRAVFFGTSMGGIITMAVAGKRLSAIAGAVLNDVGPILSTKGLARLAGYVGKNTPIESWDDAAARVRDINAIAFPDNSMDEWQRWARRAFRQGSDGRFMLNYDPAIAESLKAIRVKRSTLPARLLFRRLARNRPTLLVHGETSDILDAAGVAYMRRAAPSMQLVDVPGIGHAPMMTEPPAWMAIERFLSGVI